MAEALATSANYKPRSKHRVARLSIALASLLAACSSDKGMSGAASSTSASTEVTASKGATAEFTFDDHATSQEQHIGVQVYGDYTLAGKNKPNGSYNHGDVVLIDCKVASGTTGRSVPYPGFTSDEWGGFDGADGKRHFAPRTFGDVDDQAFQRLHDCDPITTPQP